MVTIKQSKCQETDICDTLEQWFPNCVQQGHDSCGKKGCFLKKQKTKTKT